MNADSAHAAKPPDGLLVQISDARHRLQCEVRTLVSLSPNAGAVWQIERRVTSEKYVREAYTLLRRAEDNANRRRKDCDQVISREICVTKF